LRVSPSARSGYSREKRGGRQQSCTHTCIWATGKTIGREWGTRHIWLREKKGKEVIPRIDPSGGEKKERGIANPSVRPVKEATPSALLFERAVSGKGKKRLTERKHAVEAMSGKKGGDKTLPKKKKKKGIVPGG